MADTTDLPTLRYTAGSTVVPGDRLGTIRQVLPGTGCYMKGGHVYASVVGKLSVDHRQNDNNKNQFIARIQVKDSRRIASSQVVSVGNIVLAKVTRLTNQGQGAEVVIVAVKGAGFLRHPAEGTVQLEVLSKNQESQANLLPGDMVLCRVLSLGDARRYVLSAAEPGLGVVRQNQLMSGSEEVCDDTRT